MDVEHGHGWLARPIIRLMKLPAAGTGLPVALDIVERGAELVWRRRIGRSVLQTRQRACGARLVERSGFGRITFDLAVRDGALLYRQSSMHVAGLRLPPSLSPRVEAVVSSRAEGWHVAVTVNWRGRLLCRYAGTIGVS
jgi:hypothetical protein